MKQDTDNTEFKTIDITDRLMWKPQDLDQISNTNKLKGHMLRTLLYDGWDAHALKSADTLMRLIKDSVWCSVSAESVQGHVFAVCQDLGDRYVRLEYMDDRLEIAFIGDITKICSESELNRVVKGFDTDEACGDDDVCALMSRTDIDPVDVAFAKREDTAFAINDKGDYVEPIFVRR